MATVKGELTKNFTSEEAAHHSKISIIGTGAVGVACAASVLLKVSYVFSAIGLTKFPSFGCKATAYGCAGCIQLKG